MRGKVVCARMGSLGHDHEPQSNTKNSARVLRLHIILCSWNGQISTRTCRDVQVHMGRVIILLEGHIKSDELSPAITEMEMRSGMERLPLQSPLRSVGVILIHAKHLMMPCTGRTGPRSLTAGLQ